MHCDDAQELEKRNVHLEEQLSQHISMCESLREQVR